ncbi:MAG: PLDc N-terminal domain-containing protein [Sumerlaeia bacterium]
MSILGLIHLILFIYAIIKIVQSSASLVAKIVWSLIVFIFPLVGLIVWFFIGPK